MSPDAMLLTLAMRLLAWTGDTDEIAQAIAGEARTPWEATMAVAVAFREGGNRAAAVGDQGRALCVFQLHRAPRAVLTDVRLCARIGLERIRTSARLCPATPLAAYAGARCGSETAARISADRDRVRRRVFARLGVTL